MEIIRPSKEPLYHSYFPSLRKIWLASQLFVARSSSSQEQLRIGIGLPLQEAISFLRSLLPLSRNVLSLSLSLFFPAILNKISLSRFGLNMAQPLIPFTSAVHEATRKVCPKYVKRSSCNLLASIDFLKDFALSTRKVCRFQINLT